MCGEEMGKSASRKLTLSSHLENFVFFVAMLLGITLEGACLYWVGAISVTSTPAGHPANLVGQWTAATLPQCWLIGALLVLFYRVSAILVLPQTWDQAEAQSNRRGFVRPWYWTVALGVLQAGTLCMDCFAHGVD